MCRRARDATQVISLEIFLFAIMIGHILIEKYKITHTHENVKRSIKLFQIVIFPI